MRKLISMLLAGALMMSPAAGVMAEDSAEQSAAEASADISMYVLSGPTGIGAMNLWDSADKGETVNSYQITMSGENTEVVAAISNGDADIACVATNLASTLYNKTEGGVTVLAVNTLGVLSMLSSEETFSEISDLGGHTIYAPGQGANPEYILRYVLEGNGLDPESDVTIQFVGEGSELLTVWQNDPEAVIMAPQPVATSILMQNEGSSKIFDMTEEWEKIADGESQLVMGCVIVRNEFLEENPEAVETFMTEYQASIDAAKNDVETTAALCESFGLIPKAALAQKAIPECGLTFMAGEEMKEALSGYLEVMMNFNPQSVGGSLPTDDFYYGA